MSNNIHYKIQTFGCKVNTYDTGLLQNRLSEVGFQSSESPDVFILNTCAVTSEATREALRTIRKIKTKNPSSTVVVTGCAAQVDKDQFENFKGADLLIANSHKGQIEEIVKKYLKGEIKEKVFHSNIFHKDDLEAGGGLEEGHTRVFLKIQDGCNSFCSYCIIPFARGKSRSIRIKDLTQRVQELNWNGANEVVLTGVHIGDYEDDTLENNNKLEDLIESILKHTKISRIRLTSLEPVEISERLLDLYNDPRMCRHFHMSIQSANSKVLSDMKRKYTAHDVEDALNTINKKVPQSFVGMDVITGFVGESDADFEDTYKRLSNLPWTRIHVFPYSERPGTKALKLSGSVPPKERRHRAQQLRELSSARYAEKALEQVSSVKPALILKKTGSFTQALSRDYWPIQIQSETYPQDIGVEKHVKIIGYDHSLKSRMDGYLSGILVDA